MPSNKLLDGGNALCHIHKREICPNRAPYLRQHSRENMAAALARKVSGLLRPLSGSLCAKTSQLCKLSSLIQPPPRYSSAAAAVRAPMPAAVCQTPRYNLLQRVTALIPSLNQQPSRSLTYVSLKKGKRKTVKAVTDRFMRLHCDLWIRRKAGYKKKLWKKKPARRKRLREHVFCNKTQSKLFDKMTTSFWKRRNWYVNDPYLKYHDRVNLKL
ncbi:large ribosomal subunit protein bL35m [Etheostoma spectabile]|uniref:large ribosomal subunit protein bL35m n=1 Tax=Etheostoma spectabile TaxID=54343 RepID=UPI0013AF0BD2|nr:39S ribosomal protein L35, mitochondrial [Etheostoma spectabile]